MKTIKHSSDLVDLNKNIITCRFDIFLFRVVKARVKNVNFVLAMLSGTLRMKQWGQILSLWMRTINRDKIWVHVYAICRHDWGQIDENKIFLIILKKLRPRATAIFLNFSTFFWLDKSRMKQHPSCRACNHCHLPIVGKGPYVVLMRVHSKGSQDCPHLCSSAASTINLAPSCMERCAA